MSEQVIKSLYKISIWTVDELDKYINADENNYMDLLRTWEACTGLLDREDLVRYLVHNINEDHIPPNKTYYSLFDMAIGRQKYELAELISINPHITYPVENTAIYDMYYFEILVNHKLIDNPDINIYGEGTGCYDEHVKRNKKYMKDVCTYKYNVIFNTVKHITQLPHDNERVGPLLPPELCDIIASYLYTKY